MDIKLDSVFLLVLLVFTAIATMIGIVWVIVTEKRLKRFFLGKKAKDLEDTIAILSGDIASLKQTREEIQKDLTFLNAKLKKSVRGLEVIRFNPFLDQGGNQSFAIGMLDEEGNGAVLSSLYSRERVSIFAKPIKNHKSEYELSAEERQVLEKAKLS